jgi:hypothetical protein
LPLERTPPPRRRWAWAVLIGVLAAHAVQAARLFPGVRASFDPDAPVIVVDHALHQYHGALGARFLRERGTTWGYDPAFMAGYPETPVFDPSANLSILFQWLAGGRYSPLAYKVGLMACSMVVALAIPAGARAAGLGWSEAAMASAFGWLYFWAGFPIAMWRSGLVAFSTASAASVLLVGLAVRFDARPSRAGWLALTATGAAVFFAHVTMPVVAAGGVAGFLAATARRHGWRWRAALGTALGLTALVNLPWLVPLWRFRGIRTTTYIFLKADSATYLASFYLGEKADERLSLVLLVLGAAGLASWWVEGRRARVAAFGGSIVALLVVFGFGSLWEVTLTLEPLRFRIPLNFLLAVPAGSAVCIASARLAKAIGGGRRGAVAVALAWLVLVGGIVAATPRTSLMILARLIEHRPLVVGLRPEMRRLVRWIKAETDPSARILFEDQLRLLEMTDPESVHWTPLLPLLLGDDGRQFIGGLYLTAAIEHNKAASFGDFRLADRPIDRWSQAELSAYCDRYNVGWVVCWSPLSRFVFDRFGPARRVATLPRYVTPGSTGSNHPDEWRGIASRAGIDVASRYMAEGEGQYALYRIERPHSYFLAGRGRFDEVGPNRVVLGDVEPEGGEVVLSLHWLDTWRTDPPLPLSPAPVPGDPVPFVRIALDRPLGRIALDNGYGRPRSGADGASKAPGP